MSERELEMLHLGLMNGMSDRDRRNVRRAVQLRADPFATQLERERDVVAMMPVGHIMSVGR